jgi:hypothetical protein
LTGSLSGLPIGQTTHEELGHTRARLRPVDVASNTDPDLFPLTAQSDAARVAAETAALRREAADILRRSRRYHDLRRRELLLERRWYVAPAGRDR